VKVIAAGIGKSFQSVYREIARNRKPDGTYQPWWAHNQAVLRRQRPKPRRISKGCRLQQAVAAKLSLKWSTQQISRFLARSFPGDPSMRACPETIYEALFTGTLGPRDGKLRTGRCRRKPHRRGVPKPNKIKNMKRLGARPAEVADRTMPGHWEGDLIIGKKLHSAIGTLVERASRFVVLVDLPHGYKAPQVRDALVQELLQFPPVLRRTLTWDQGREMTLHDDVAAATGLDVFFCDPHSPWQRGTNENTNGLLRQYFPKHTDLAVHTRRDLERVALELNQRPRLVLSDRTPEQVLTHRDQQHLIVRDHRQKPASLSGPARRAALVGEDMFMPRALAQKLAEIPADGACIAEVDVGLNAAERSLLRQRPIEVDRVLPFPHHRSRPVDEDSLGLADKSVDTEQVPARGHHPTTRRGGPAPGPLDPDRDQPVLCLNMEFGQGVSQQACRVIEPAGAALLVVLLPLLLETRVLLHRQILCASPARLGSRCRSALSSLSLL
jgi:transposase, IS30 family